MIYNHEKVLDYLRSIPSDDPKWSSVTQLVYGRVNKGNAVKRWVNKGDKQRQDHVSMMNATKLQKKGLT